MKLTPKMKLWLSDENANGFFGVGKFRLLQAIESHGSLSAAAKSLGISYRKAWDDLRKTEDRFGKKLITRKRGGEGGGGATLTPEAKKLIKAYSSFCKKAEEQVDDVYRETMKEVIDGNF